VRPPCEIWVIGGVLCVMVAAAESCDPWVVT